MNWLPASVLPKRQPHPAILAFPSVKDLGTDVVLAADRFMALPTRLRLPQDANNRLGRMICLLHDGFPFFARKPSHPQWPSSWGPNHSMALAKNFRRACCMLFKPIVKSAQRVEAARVCDLNDFEYGGD